MRTICGACETGFSKPYYDGEQCPICRASHSWPTDEELNQAREEAEMEQGDNTPPPPSKEARA
jgi:hypothetical protein